MFGQFLGRRGKNESKILLDLFFVSHKLGGFGGKHLG
jgi:hypothetical protein